MKKTILDAVARQQIFARLEKISPSAKAGWGKMNVKQMLPHCGDQFRLAMNEIPVTGKSSFLGRTIARWLVLAGMPAPKGKVQTFPEIDQLNAGTPPKEFEQDKQNLRKLIEEFVSKDESFNWAYHPFFGKMTQKTWAKLAYSHLDHHFKQFGG